MSTLYNILQKIGVYHHVDKNPLVNDYDYVLDRLSLGMDLDEIPIDLPDEIEQVIQQYEQGIYPDILKKLEEKHPERAEVINRLSPIPGVGVGLANYAYKNGWYTLEDLVDKSDINKNRKKLIFWKDHVTSSITDEDFDAIKTCLNELLLPHGLTHSVSREKDKMNDREEIKLTIKVDDLYIPNMKMIIASISEDVIIEILKPVLVEVFHNIQSIYGIIQVKSNVYPAHEIIIRVYPESLYDKMV